MVKRLREKSARLLSAAGGSGTRPVISKDATLHRGRKKRLEKRQRQAAKQAFVQDELARISEAKKKKKSTKKRKKTPAGPALSILTPLQDALPAEEREPNEDAKETETERNARQGAVRHRARRRLLVDETEQVNNVRKFEGFVHNPVEALRQHLMNTISNDPCEIAPAIGEDKKAEKSKETSGGKVKLEIGKKGLEEARTMARERVREKVAEKKRFAEAAAALKKKRDDSKIKKQRLGGAARGRIGVKREKILG